MAFNREKAIKIYEEKLAELESKTLESLKKELSENIAKLIDIDTELFKIQKNISSCVFDDIIRKTDLLIKKIDLRADQGDLNRIIREKEVK